MTKQWTNKEWKDIDFLIDFFLRQLVETASDLGRDIFEKYIPEIPDDADDADFMPYIEDALHIIRDQYLAEPKMHGNRFVANAKTREIHRAGGWIAYKAKQAKLKTQIQQSMELSDTAKQSQIDANKSQILTNKCTRRIALAALIVAILSLAVSIFATIQNNRKSFWPTTSFPCTRNPCAETESPK